MTNSGTTEDDTRYRDMRRNLIFGEGKSLDSGQSLNETN